MALSTTGSQVQYTGTNTPNQVCPFPYLFFANSDLEVVTLSASNVVTTLVLGTHYSVSGAGNATGGSVTVFAAVPATTKISISRNLPETQLVSFSTGDRFPASIMERALDKLTMLVQEVGRGVSKSLRITDVGETQAALVPRPASVMATNSESQVGFISSAEVTGATPFFLAANSAGQPPQFQPLPPITESRIANEAVTESKIAPNAVTPSKVGGNPSVGQWVLGSTNGQVVWQLPSSTSLEDDAVTTSKLADNAVTSGKLQSDASTDANRAVTTNHIRNNAVTSGKLQSDANTDANRAVTANHIRDNAVTSGKLQSDANTDANRAVTTNHIRDNAVTSDKLQSDANTDANRAVTANHIRNLAVTSEKLADGSVDFSKVASGMVVGRAYVQSAAISSIIGNDPQMVMTDALPLITQGIQILALNYTPKALGNILVARFYVTTSTGASAVNAGAMIFQNTSCIAANMTTRPANTWGELDVSTNNVVVTNLNQRTFSARIGLTGAAAGTTKLLHINAVSSTGTRVFGGATQMILEVTEYKA